MMEIKNYESAIPGRLSDIAEFDALDESDTRLTRRFQFTWVDDEGKVLWGINDKVFDPGRMDARPRLGSTEIWEFTTDAHHPVHLHLVRFNGYRGRYVFHCRNLEHEDMMMANFEVV
jgi:spore coat protein A